MQHTCKSQDFRFHTCTLRTLIAIVSLCGASLAHAGDPPVCLTTSADTDGDGWGWENNQTCRTTAQSRRSCSSALNDSDGDGWGWENGQSCVVDGHPTLPTNRRNWPDCQRSDSDSDGDGWGWENDQSCVVTSGQTDADNADDEDSSTSSLPNCESPNSDSDGDGWGWENGRTCLVRLNKPEQPDDRDTDSDTTNRLPTCLSDASDPLSSGYGYEFGRSCLVIEGVTRNRYNPLLNHEFCGSWNELSYGNYRLQNNTWNEAAMYSDNWSQCIELQGSSGAYVPVWRFNWLGRNDGDLREVKSYPQVYYGRKNQWNFSGSMAETGLPAPLDTLENFTVDYEFSTSGNAEYNVALESFFHSSCDAENDNKVFEMMVWVGIPNEKTPGTQITTATIDNQVWKVYANPALGWGYVAFVAEKTTPAGTLDWNAFIDWSRDHSVSLGLGSMENTCMGAIEMGTETFWGNLEFRLNKFSVTRR